MKKKTKTNYYRKFFEFCDKHRLWTSFFSDGTVDEITCVNGDCPHNDNDYINLPDVVVGSKAAYLRLARAHKEHAERRAK